MCLLPSQSKAKKAWWEIRKQDCVVADGSGTCRLVLWQEEIGALQVNSSHRVSAVHVRMYDDLYYLSAAEKCEIEKIEDIGEVQQVSDGSQKGASGKVVVGKFISVVSSEIYNFVCDVLV